MNNSKILVKNKYVAGCGIELREDEGWVCPYYANIGRWNDAGKRGYGSCQIDLQIGSNICLHAPIFDEDYLRGENNKNPPDDG